VKRLTRNAFTDLAIWMIGLGLLMGLVFPIFIIALGIPSSFVLTPWFFASSIGAGMLVGAANVWLARTVVCRPLRLLAERMRFITGNLQEVSRDGDFVNCRPDKCFLDCDTDDEIGESGKAFNHLVEELAQSLETQGAVKVFTEMLSSHLELDPLTEQALEQLQQQTGAGGGAILIESDGALRVVASMGLRSVAALVDSDHVRRALRSGVRQLLELPEDITLEGVVTDFRPRQVIVLPVLYKQVPLGAIILANAKNFSEDASKRLDLLQQGLALALHNALAHDRLQRLAALDPLTGIFNRRFGMARLHEEFSRAIRVSAPVGVMMFDLDHFKNVNDTYGHLVGDRVLIQVVRVARLVVREGDILVRYGGEEFLMILPGATKDDAAKIGERLLRMVEETCIADGTQNIKVTVSIGISAYPEMDAKEAIDLVGDADQAMYKAKESGRNRLVVA
jgi:diguanylate cyclase (GGDEF)-like protein